MTLEPFDIHLVWLRVVERLEILRARVREGRDVFEAKEFSCWITFSGLLKIFEACSAPMPHRVDAQHTRDLAQDVLWECEKRWKNQNEESNLRVSEFEKMNGKLDELLRSNSVRTPAQPTATPPLRVLPGGKA